MVRTLRYIGGPLDGRILPTAGIAPEVHRNVDTYRTGSATHSASNSTTYVPMAFDLRGPGGLRHAERVMAASYLSRRQVAEDIRDSLPGGHRYSVPSLLGLRHGSSLVQGVAYDHSQQTMDVYLGRRQDAVCAVYRYYGVSPELALDFITTDSHGRFYCERVRNQFPCETIGKAQRQCDSTWAWGNAES